MILNRVHFETAFQSFLHSAWASRQVARPSDFQIRFLVDDSDYVSQGHSRRNKQAITALFITQPDKKKMQHASSTLRTTSEWIGVVDSESEIHFPRSTLVFNLPLFFEISWSFSLLEFWFPLQDEPDPLRKRENVDPSRGCSWRFFRWISSDLAPQSLN